MGRNLAGGGAGFTISRYSGGTTCLARMYELSRTFFAISSGCSRGVSDGADHLGDMFRDSGLPARGERRIVGPVQSPRFCMVVGASRWGGSRQRGLGWNSEKCKSAYFATRIACGGPLSLKWRSQKSQRNRARRHPPGGQFCVSG